MNVTIIGTGNMGRGIGHRLAKGGHNVTLIGTNTESAEKLAAELRTVAKVGVSVKAATSNDPIEDDVIILAVSYPTNKQLATQLGARLADKIVVDISNPVNETYDALATEPGTSAAEEIAKLVPEGAKVVKAFNTTFAGTLVEGSIGGQRLDVLIAGDDEGAKDIVVQMVRDGGLVPVDVGPLQRAQQLEALGFLSISMQDPLNLNFMSGWKLIS